MSKKLERIVERMWSGCGADGEADVERIVKQMVKQIIAKYSYIL